MNPLVPIVHALTAKQVAIFFRPLKFPKVFYYSRLNTAMNNRKNYGIAFIQVFISTPSPPTRTLLNKILKLSFGFGAVRFFLSRDYSPEKRAKSLNLLSRSIHSFLSSASLGERKGKN